MPFRAGGKRNERKKARNQLLSNNIFHQNNQETVKLVSQEALEELGIKHIAAGAHHPQTNGKVDWVKCSSHFAASNTP